MEYASKGVSGTALGLGIAGTALGILDGLGGIGALLGNRQPVAEGDRPVTRYEMGLYQTINAKDNEITVLKAAQYTDHAAAGLQAQIGQQAVYNATVTANLGCLQGQIAQLQAMTRLVIPNANLSPGYGAVTVTPEAVAVAATPTAAGS